jgi:hypothetical protein
MKYERLFVNGSAMSMPQGLHSAFPLHGRGSDSFATTRHSAKVDIEVM